MRHCMQQYIVKFVRKLTLTNFSSDIVYATKSCRTWHKILKLVILPNSNRKIFNKSLNYPADLETTIRTYEQNRSLWTFRHSFNLHSFLLTSTLFGCHIHTQYQRLKIKVFHSFLTFLKCFVKNTFGVYIVVLCCKRHVLEKS